MACCFTTSSKPKVNSVSNQKPARKEKNPWIVFVSQATSEQGMDPSPATSALECCSLPGHASHSQAQHSAPRHLPFSWGCSCIRGSGCYKQGQPYQESPHLIQEQAVTTGKPFQRYNYLSEKPTHGSYPMNTQGLIFSLRSFMIMFTNYH